MMTKRDSAADSVGDEETLEPAKAGLESAERTGDDAKLPLEIGGPKGPEPTRYGDWERNGRCSDF